jgi:hypothetical protein
MIEGQDPKSSRTFAISRRANWSDSDESRPESPIEQHTQAKERLHTNWRNQRRSANDIVVVRLNAQSHTIVR